MAEAPSLHYHTTGLVTGLQARVPSVQGSFGFLDDDIISVLDMPLVGSSCTNCKSDAEYPIETGLCKHNVTSSREAPEHILIEFI